jgi:hypothetical protein
MQNALCVMNKPFQGSHNQFAVIFFEHRIRMSNFKSLRRVLALRERLNNISLFVMVFSQPVAANKTASPPG